MKILCFGSMNNDHFYKVGKLPGEGETVASLGMETFPGGKGLNQSIAMARAGATVYHGGTLGGDGELPLSALLSEGVDISFIRTEGQLATGHAIVAVDDDGRNSIIVHGGANYAQTPEHVDSVFSGFAEGDFLVLQNEINDMSEILGKATERGFVTVLNPSPINEEIWKMDLGGLDYMILNETETLEILGHCGYSMGLAGADNPTLARALHTVYPKVKLVCTFGEEGAMYLDGDEEIVQEAFAVEPVDTTGAGDTFAGYFTAAIAMGKSPKDAMRLAAGAGALCCTKPGAGPSIPGVKDVEAFIAIKS